MRISRQNGSFGAGSQFDSLSLPGKSARALMRACRCARLIRGAGNLAALDAQLAGLVEPGHR